MALFLASSLGLHAVALGVASSSPQQGDIAQPSKAMELLVVDVVKEKPPPIDEPKTDPPKAKVKPRPIQIAQLQKIPLKPKDEAPPPPNEEPEAAPQRAPLVVGLSMSSTTTGGGFAAPVGNTLYGKAPERAPAEAKPYSAPRYTPIYQVDSAPVLVSDFREYPKEAQQAGIEGTVTLSITIDTEGSVVNARVLKGPGNGLNEAALEAIRKCKFKPAMKAGQPVSTEIEYRYTFQLN